MIEEVLLLTKDENQ